MLNRTKKGMRKSINTCMTYIHIMYTYARVSYLPIAREYLKRKLKNPKRYKFYTFKTKFKNKTQ